MVVRSGFEAYYNVPGEKRLTRLDVVLWDVDAEGRAAGYVINGGKLVAAESVAGFHHYEKQDPEPVVAALPGDGWWATFEPNPDGSPATPREALCWTVEPTASCARW